MVVVRDGESSTKAQLSTRLQEAIDEAAMRLGDTSSSDYLAGWTRSAWRTEPGDPADVAARVAQRLEQEWDDGRVAGYLDGLNADGAARH